MTRKVSRQRAWQLRKVAEGRCQRCGNPRGKDGTKTQCRPCAQKHSDYRMGLYYAEKEAE